jgi:hypothetical protein
MPRGKSGLGKRGETGMRNLFAAIPEDVFKALKLYAVQNDMEMRDVVAEALRRFLSLKGGEKNKK